MKLFELFQNKAAPLETIDWSWLDQDRSIYKNLVEGLDENGRYIVDLAPASTKNIAGQQLPNNGPAGSRDGYILLHTHRKAHPKQTAETLALFLQAIHSFSQDDIQKLHKHLETFDILP